MSFKLNDKYFSKRVIYIESKSWWRTAGNPTLSGPTEVFINKNPYCDRCQNICKYNMGFELDNMIICEMCINALKLVKFNPNGIYNKKRIHFKQEYHLVIFCKFQKSFKKYRSIFFN